MLVHTGKICKDLDTTFSLRRSFAELTACSEFIDFNSYFTIINKILLVVAISITLLTINCRKTLQMFSAHIHSTHSLTFTVVLTLVVVATVILLTILGVYK